MDGSHWYSRIGCRGEVGSVILHSDRPVVEVERKIYSRHCSVRHGRTTSGNLIGTALESGGRFGGSGSPAPARLLIGDTALRTAQCGSAGFIYDRTRRGGISRVKILSSVRGAMLASLLKGILKKSGRCIIYFSIYLMGCTHRDGVIVEASHITGLDGPTLHTYFEKLVYDLDPGMWEGLNIFMNLLGYGRDRLQTYGTPKDRLSGLKEMTARL